MRWYSLLIAVALVASTDYVRAGEPVRSIDFMKHDPTSEQLIDALRTPPQKLRSRSITVVQEEPASKVLLRIPFEFNSAELTPEARKTLGVLGEALTSDELLNNRFEISGHTDGKGAAAYNKELSTQRALAVKNYLEHRENIADGRLVPVGKGETELFDRENPLSAENRRVEIINLGPHRDN